MEFITTATQLPVITTNFEEVKKYIEGKRDMYKGVIVTEDTLKESRADLSDLIKIRTSIEEFRKSKKKEMLVPITAFENQCKKLLAIEAEAEAPLAAGINKLDEERRQKKRELAKKLIQEAITARGLNTKFASRLELKDSYVLLTATQKGVKTEIGQDADALLALQNAEEENIALIKDTVNKENADLLTALKPGEFASLIDKKPIRDIMELIRCRASDIREAQKLAEERARKAAERAKVETPPVIAQEQMQTTNTQPVNYVHTTTPSCPNPSAAIPAQTPIAPTAPAPSQSEEKWNVTFSVSGSFAQMKELCDIIKSKQLIYSILEQKRI